MRGDRSESGAGRALGERRRGAPILIFDTTSLYLVARPRVRTEIPLCSLIVRKRGLSPVAEAGRVARLDPDHGDHLSYLFFTNATPFQPVCVGSPR